MMLYEYFEKVPLVIWIRQADRMLWNLSTPQKVEIIPTREYYLIKLDWVSKQLRISKQNLNIARNKGQDRQAKELLEQSRVLKQEKKDIQSKLEDPNLPITSPPQNPNNIPRTAKSRENVNTTTQLKTLREVFSWNIEKVMYWFWNSRIILPDFENLIKYGTIEGYEDLIREQIQKESERLRDERWIDIDNEDARNLIKEYEKRIQEEFKALLEIRKFEDQIPETIRMTLNYNWRELPPWELKIENTKEINEYFGRLVEAMRERSEEIYPN